MATIELVGLPSASVLGDADLLHLRVGDIDRKITGEDFKASILPVYATTTVPGIVEKATQTEVNDGVDNERYVTPLTLKNLLDAVISASGAPNATTTNRGLVELATTAEGQAGTDTERAVTPQVMRDSVTTHVSQATTTLAGKARIATQTEVNAGTDNTTIVTPLTLKNAPGVSVPDASTTVAGKIELATQGEVNLGTDDVRAVTPATLANSTWVNIPSATTSIQGKVELADLSETQIGTDQTRAVTPYGLKNALPTLIPAASETNAGIAEIATLAEVNAGTDTVRYVTPYTLAQSLSGSTVPLASETVAGRIEIATTAEAQGGTDDARAITPLKLKNSVMTHVLAADGPGSGLDADTLDGVQGSGYALVSHEHPWPTSLSFSTSTGTLTMGRQTGGNLTASFDGRYLKLAGTNSTWEVDPGVGIIGGHYKLESQATDNKRTLNVRNLHTGNFAHGLSGYVVGPNSIGVLGYTFATGTNTFGVAGFYNGTDTSVSSGLLGGQDWSVQGFVKPIRGNAGFSPFTGCHIGITSTNINRFIEVGDVMEADDAILFNVDDSAPILSLAKEAKSKKVVGVVKVYNRMSFKDAFSPCTGMLSKVANEEGPEEFSDFGKQVLDKWGKYKVCEINSVGEGGINVCDAGGDIEAGDFLCSSEVSGKAMKQDDDILHNYTVAKAMQDVVWENEVVGKNGCYEKNGHKWKMIACTYHCG